MEELEVVRWCYVCYAPRRFVLDPDVYFRFSPWRQWKCIGCTVRSMDISIPSVILP